MLKQSQWKTYIFFNFRVIKCRSSRCLSKQLFLEILQYSQKMYRSLFFIKRLQCRFFPVNIAKFLRTVFFYRIPLVAASINGLTPEILILWALFQKNRAHEATNAWIFMKKNRCILINFGRFEDGAPLISCKFKVIRVWKCQKYL